MQLTINIIDAFTNRPFKGNPAAVIIHDKALDESIMQSIAMENNLSETAFAIRRQDSDVFDIRWFSPVMEIDFCGHASLATAFLLFQKDKGVEKITFFASAVGEFTAEKSKNGFISLNFPNRKPEPVREPPAALLAGLSIHPVEVWRSRQAYFAIYERAADILNTVPDLTLLKKLEPWDVVITAASDSPAEDFVSRYFWPAHGGTEDPVTGSIHAGLAPFWSERLNKQTLTAFQASKRGGQIHCRVDGDRVIISGQAVSYLEGTIDI